MPLTGSLVTKILLCAVFIDLTVKGLVESRSIRRRHGHHLHLDRYNSMESIPRELSSRRLERQNSNLRLHETYRRNNENIFKNTDDNYHGLTETGPRRKRHGSVTYKKMTEQDRIELLKFKQMNSDWVDLLNNQHTKRFDDYYELEVKEAQNSSLCNYTVVAIPDTKGSRIPSDLEHVICNHVGSTCHNVGPYCCIQTYRKVKVWYADGTSEILKVYAGCVCSLQVVGDLDAAEKRLPIND